MKLAFAAALAMALTPFAVAADQKIEGEAQCGKCSLKKSEECHTVVVTKKGGTETVYWVEKGDKDKDLHTEICTTAKPVPGEGTVSEKDGKKLLKIAKYELKK